MIVSSILVVGTCFLCCCVSRSISQLKPFQNGKAGWELCVRGRLTDWRLALEWETSPGEGASLRPLTPHAITLKSLNHQASSVPFLN